MTNEKQNGAPPAAGKAAAGAGDGGQPPVDNPTPNAPPATPDAGDESGAEDEDEDLLDDDAEDYEAAAGDDPRLRDALPSFRHHDAFMRARIAMGDDQMAAEQAPWLRAVFDEIRRTMAAGAPVMPAETAWRMMVKAGAPLFPWTEREKDEEIPIAVFVATAAALIPLADAQVKAFELAVVTITGEDRLARMRQARAGRRKRRLDRQARRPEAAAALIEQRKANLKASLIDRVKALSTPKEAKSGQPVEARREKSKKK